MVFSEMRVKGDTDIAFIATDIEEEKRRRRRRSTGEKGREETTLDQRTDPLFHCVERVIVVKVPIQSLSITSPRWAP